MPQDEAMSPRRIPASESGFGFDDLKTNRIRYTEYKDKKASSVIENMATATINRYGDSHNGSIVGLNHADRTIFYYVQYKQLNKKLMGQTVTQTLLWSQRSAITQNLTRKMVFDYLLKQWPIIMSDTQQTPDGERFWRSLISIADGKGLEYGLANLNTQEIEKPEKDEGPLDFWDRVNDKAYGTHEKFEARRFWIKA